MASHDSQAKLATKYDSRLCRYEKKATPRFGFISLRNTIRDYVATIKGYAMNGYATIRLYKPTKSSFVLRFSFFVLRFSSFVFRPSFFVLRSSFFVLRFSFFVLRLSSFVFRPSSFVLRLSFFVPRSLDYNGLMKAVGM